MSIIRIGLGETDGFAEGYEAIFGKKKPKAETPAEPAKPSANPTESEAVKTPDDEAKK